MTTSTTLRMTTTIVLGCLLLFALPALLPTSAQAKLIENRELNFEIELPPGWSELPKNESWAKSGVVVGGVKELVTLKDGTPAKGEGGQVHLAISDAPAGKSIDDIAKDPEVRAFLLNRFSTDPAAWPEVEVVPDQWDGGLDVRVLRVQGKAANLKGRRAPTRGVLLVVVAKKKLYKLRLYGFPTEHDREGVKGDLDVIEMNFFIPDTTEEKESEGERPPPEMGEEEEVPEGDTAEEKVFEDLKLGWRLTKPKGIKSHDWDKEAYKDAVAWFEGNDAIGSYQIIIYVIKRGRRSAQNIVIPDLVLTEWGLDPWWGRFCESHPNGPILTYKWPRKSKSWLTLPNFEAEKVIAKKPSRRMEEADAGDLIKKMKAAEKIKKQDMGEENTIKAYRGVLSGNREKIGEEVVLRYLWGTPRLTCMIAISLARGGKKKWYDEVNALLESIEMTGRPR